MIPNLVSLDYARLHLRTLTADDTDLESKTWLASQIVANHCKLKDIPADWIVEEASPEISDIAILETADSPPLSIIVPGNIQAAVILVAGELFENRESGVSDPLSPTVLNLLEGFRTPSLA